MAFFQYLSYTPSCATSRLWETGYTAMATQMNFFIIYAHKLVLGFGSVRSNEKTLQEFCMQGIIISGNLLGILLRFYLTSYKKNASATIPPA